MAYRKTTMANKHMANRDMAKRHHIYYALYKPAKRFAALQQYIMNGVNQD